MVAQLSPEFTARIVDRWQELEKVVQTEQPTKRLSPAMQLMSDMLGAAELFEVPQHLAQVEVTKSVLLLTGLDLGGVLKLAPAQSNLAIEDMFLEPTELGKRAGLTAVKVNQALAAAGLQTKGVSGWQPTGKAANLSSLHQWAVGSKSGYNLKWRESVLKLISK